MHMILYPSSSSSHHLFSYMILWPPIPSCLPTCMAPPPLHTHTHTHCMIKLDSPTYPSWYLQVLSYCDHHIMLYTTSLDDYVLAFNWYMVKHILLDWWILDSIFHPLLKKRRRWATNLPCRACMQHERNQQTHELTGLIYVSLFVIKPAGCCICWRSCSKQGRQSV